MAKTLTLSEVRAKIDAIDTQLLKLIDQRSALAREVAEAKRATGDGGGIALRPAREAQILRRIAGAEKDAAIRSGRET